MVARRRRLPDLPALVPGLRRRRGRRPARDHPAPRRRGRPRRGRPVALADVPVAVCRRRLRHRRPHRRRPAPRQRRRRRRAGGGGARAGDARCCSTSCPTTPRSSTPGSGSIPTATCGRTHRRTTGGRRSAAPRGRATRTPGGATCTRSTPSSPTSTGATRPSPPRCTRSCAPGSPAASTASASTQSIASASIPTCWTTRPRGCRRRSPRRPTRPCSSTATRATGRRPCTPALAGLRAAAGDAFLVGEVYLPTADLGPYLDHLSSAFVFELLFAEWRADLVGALVARAARLAHPAWMLSNHDFSRVGTRIGERNQPAAAMLLLTLPGTVFLYQGDEIGLLDGPDGDPPDDRFGRDRHRHPMQWDAGPQGGFTTGAPWLPPIDPAVRNVAGQRADPASLWSLHHDLIALRRELGGGLELVAAEEGGLLAYRRGDVLVALNLGAATLPLPAGEPLLAHPSRHVTAAGRRRRSCARPEYPFRHAVGHGNAPPRRRDRLPAGPAPSGALCPRPAAARRAGRHQRDPAVRRGGARSRPHRRARDRPRDDPACEHRRERRSHARLRPPVPADLEPPARALAGHQPGPAARARHAADLGLPHRRPALRPRRPPPRLGRALVAPLGDRGLGHGGPRRCSPPTASRAAATWS